ncbi:MAG: GNAT family N-acetyltransferase, partial [Chloroflexota bacterium]|nr:GNAT family N-acetyltransferase [Chloroflexota bacterium]
MPTLETDRLIIRPFVAADIDAAYAVFEGHPDVWRYDPGRQRTYEERAREIQYRIAQYAREGFGCMAVTRRSDGVLLGYCGLQTWLRATHPLASLETELFYKLGRAYWGQGYATEACRAMIAHAFTDLRLPRLVTVTAAANAESLALLRRLGMQIVPSPTDPAEVNGILAHPLGADQTDLSPNP